MIYITDRAWRLMMLAAKHNNGLEVAWFAKGEVAEDRITVSDIIIPPQEVGGAHADIEVDQLDWLMSELLLRGENPKDWFVWCHSHVRMSTGPSGTDHATLIDLAKQARHRFAAGIVVNVKGEATGWLAYESPVLAGQYVEQTLAVEVEETDDPELLAHVAAMMENVTEHKWMPAVQSTQGTKRGSKRGTYSKKFRDDSWDKFERKGWQALTQFEAEAVLEELGHDRPFKGERDEPTSEDAFDDAYDPDDEMIELYGGLL